ncbi:MAG: D-alanyl-D-alanine carboxypeptidase family protein, partial [Desulfotomaculales bacterium]
MFWQALLLTVVFTFTAAGAAAAQVPPPPAPAGELTTTAEAAVLLDAAQGQVLYAKEPHKRLPMASVTKLMTMLLAVEAVEQNRTGMNETVVASENAWKMGGSQIYLAPGEKMSFRDMLIAVAVGSANDASVALAEHLAGSEEAFVQMMNEKARELGMKDTRFVNCTGLPAEGHYTSAYDLALLMREALNHPLF